MRTLILSHPPQSDVATRLRDSLLHHVSDARVWVEDFEQAERFCLHMKPKLVAICLPADSRPGLDVLHRVRERAFAGPMLAVGPATDARLILRAQQEGADWFLDQSEIDAQLDRCLSRLLRRNEVESPGRLLAVLPASGGCGASTLAVNVAALLAKKRGRCGLIDLNPGRGDLAALLDLQPRFTLADLCLHADRCDEAMFEKTLTRHESGVQLLTCSPTFEHAPTVSADAVVRVLKQARRAFHDVVIDLKDCFQEEQVAALRQATGIFLVCRLDFTSVRHARRVLDHFDRLEVTRQRVKVVINQQGQPDELPVGAVEDALQEEVRLVVPYDARLMNTANNTGTPVVLKRPAAKVTTSLLELAESVETDFAPRAAVGDIARDAAVGGVTLSPKLALT